MELLTGILVGFAIIGSLVRLDVTDETGKRRSMEYSRGRYSRRELAAFKNKQIEIEYEWGGKEHPKLLRISFPSPTISL
jgi:hypothetical protein